jgi:hypothetical protein
MATIYIWSKSKEVWKQMSARYTDTERYKMKGTKKKKIVLAFQKNIKEN